MNNVQDILREQIHKNKTPSVQYLIFDKDSAIYKYIDGLADIKNQRATSEHDLYHAFSTTKTFTALAVLQLAEKNLLNIDDPVKKYLPDFSYDSAITIRQLLTHSAGLPNPVPLSWIHLQNDNPTFDPNAYFKKIFAQHKTTKSKPNEKYSYSNLGYIILGHIIEQVSGKCYEQYITDNIICRLDIEQGELGFLVDGSMPCAKGYQKRFSLLNLILGFLIDKEKFMVRAEGLWKPFVPYYVNGAAYGGLIGTSNSFMKYLQELLKPESKLLTIGYKKLLFEENRTSDGKSTGMCLSWHTGKLNGQPYFSHAGGGGGYYCEIRIYYGIGIGSVIMFNRTGISDERYLDKVDKYYFIDNYGWA